MSLTAREALGIVDEQLHERHESSGRSKAL
jgi:hypothetical protein